MKTFETAVKKIARKAWGYDFEQEVDRLKEELSKLDSNKTQEDSQRGL